MRRTWKSRVIRAAAKLLAVTVTATSCLSGMTFSARAEGYGKNGVVRDMTSQQLVEDMGLGYNIGNTFDSIGSFITETDPWEYQKAWGNEPVSQLFLQKIKEAGFKTIRLPVSWAHWIDANNQINPAYIEAVRRVVDWCMDEDFYVILNIHHDGGGGDTAWIRKAATDWEGTSAKYAAVWTQIAQNFNNYGDHLIFEGMNEVEFPDAPTKSRQFELMNAMNQLFVDSVRATGGNNALRHLLIPGINTNIAQTCDRRYHMPNDPANHSILSIHYYSPPAFCVAEHDVDWAVPETTWGTEEDLQNVEKDLDMLAEHFISKGIPVIIGEYGVLTEDNKDKESIRSYVSKVPEMILQYGMCPVLWDTSNAGDMKFVERVTGEFYDPIIKNNYLNLSQRYAMGQIQRKEFYFPEYQRVDVPITPGGWTSLDTAFEPEKIVGVAFELDCTSDWDSYGGGGLYLDGWDNMPQWSFSSVYDEIVYMFSAEEKARLHDQLAVLIFWTDESKGGSRREELSIKGNKVTLLYGEDEQVHAPRLTSGKSSGGSGGGGGGRGSSRYPNNSTDPVGDDTNNERTNLYHALHEGKAVVKEGVLRQGRNHKTSEEDTDTGAYKINIKDFCPDYVVGDKVRVNVSYLSDEGNPSIALVTTENGYTSSDDDGIRNKNTLVWDCVPPDGEVTLNLWYLGNNKYFMYKVSCEILEKVPDFACEDIGSSENFGEPERTEEVNDKGNPTVTMTYPFSLAELARLSNVELGEDSRIKLTVYPVADPQEGDEYSVYFEDVNGAKVTGNLTGSSVTLIGTPKDDTVYFAFTTENIEAAQNSRAAFPSISFRNFVLKQLPAMDILAEIVSAGRVELTSTKQRPRPLEEVTEGEDGVKVYFTYDGDDVKEELGGALVVNGNWDYTSDKWDIRSDEKGEYIWCAGSAQSAVTLSLWTVKASFRIKDIIGVRKVQKAPELAENEELMTEGDDGKYHVPEGKRLAAIRFKTSGGGNAYGAMLNINADPWGVWIDFHDGEEITYKFDSKPSFTELELVDKFVDYMIFVYSDEEEPEEKFEEFTVTKDQPAEYSMKELLEKNGIAQGDRVKLTVSVRAEGSVGGEVSFTEESGMKLSGTITSDAAGASTAILLGNSADDILSFKVNDDSATNSYTVTNIVVEKAAGSVLAELQKAGRIEFALSQIETKEIEGLTDSGLKVYYEFDGDVKDVSSQLAVNGDWGEAGSNSKWTIGTDDQGSYIWYGCEEVNSVLFACWYIDKPLKITKLVYETAKKDEEEKFEEFAVTKDKPEEYDMAELLEKNGIAQGDRIKLTVSVRAEGSVGGEVSFTEESGMKISGTLFNSVAGDSTAILLGNSADDILSFKVNDDSATDSYTVTNIVVEKAEDSVLAELQKAGRIEFALSQVETKEIEGLTDPGLKVYYEFDGDVKGVSSQLVVNGDWDGKGPGGNENWTVETDAQGSYIWYGCGEVNSVLFACWYIDKPLKITKLVYETVKKGTEEPTPEQPELKDGEILVEANEDGKYYVPEGKGNPRGMRFIGTNLWGANISVNGEYWASEDANKDLTFDKDQNIEYVSFVLYDGNEDAEITGVIFIYAPEVPTPEDPTPELKDGEVLVEAAEDGKYYVPEGKGIPNAIRFNISGGSGHIKLALTLNYNEWAQGSEGWINYVENEDTTHTFADGVEFESLSIDGDGAEITINSVIFIYSGNEPETTSLMQTIANNMLYRMTGRVLAEDEEIFELEAVSDEKGIYYLPEDMEAAPVGIRAEVASDSKDVSIIFDGDSDSQVEVKPENKAVYYFFDGNADAETVQFKGQKVKNVTFLYWNGEAGEAAEGDGVFNLPDYRVPAAVYFAVGEGEDEASEAVVSVDIYDAETRQWKEEGKVLTKVLPVKADSTGWYVFTDKNLEVLEDALTAAKEGCAVPRLRFAFDGVNYAVEDVTLYYNTSYTDEMEIVEPEESKALKKAKSPAGEVKKAVEENKETGESAEENKEMKEVKDSEEKAQEPAKEDQASDEEIKEAAKEKEESAKDMLKPEEEAKKAEDKEEIDKAEDAEKAKETDKTKEAEETDKAEDAKKTDKAENTEEAKETDKAKDAEETDKAEDAEKAEKESGKTAEDKQDASENEVKVSEGNTAAKDEIEDKKASSDDDGQKEEDTTADGQKEEDTETKTDKIPTEVKDDAPKAAENQAAD